MDRIGIETIADREVECGFCGNVSTRTLIVFRKEPAIRALLAVAVFALVIVAGLYAKSAIESSAAHALRDHLLEGNK